jgi:hypothetical protein
VAESTDPSERLIPVGGGGPLSSSRRARVVDHLRGVASALVVPGSIAFGDGHVRSALARKSQDAQGRPIPSYTYPAIDFLGEIEWNEADVLEFGGGQSTLWWAERARSVFTVEEDENWFGYLEATLRGAANVECVLESDPARYAEVPRRRTFDVVVVDGGNRPKAAETTVEVVAEDGLVIVDDAEAWFGDRPGDYPIIETLQGAGFGRVDLYGYAPGVRRKHCTSVFFRGAPPAFRGLAPPVRPYRR